MNGTAATGSTTTKVTRTPAKQLPQTERRKVRGLIATHFNQSVPAVLGPGFRLEQETVILVWFTPGPKGWNTVWTFAVVVGGVVIYRAFYEVSKDTKKGTYLVMAYTCTGEMTVG